MAGTYVFRDSVRVFNNGAEEIRLRMGVFNYEEVELDMSTLSTPLSSFLREMVQLLESQEGYDEKLLTEQLLEPFEKEIVQSMLDELQATNYAVAKEEQTIGKDLTMALLGYLEQEDMDSDEEAGKKKILFFADDNYATETAISLSADMEMPITIMDKELMQEVRNADLTSNMDGLSTVKTMTALGEKFKPYDAIIGCMRNLSVIMMRNINRISLELEIPVVLSFIDGPVICILATNPYTTGCLECFELRALARLEDHVQYHNFVKAEKNYQGNGQSSAGVKPLLNMLINQLLSEAFLIRKIGVSKFTGRLLTTYLPTMEIQAQDILRLPFCPGCGAVAKARLEEKNLSSRVLVDEMVANALGRK